MVKYTIPINVTPEDIDNGIPFEAEYCPVALAAARAGYIIAIGPITVVMNYGKRYRYSNEEVRNFVLDFDAGRGVHPFETVVEVTE